MDRLGALDHPEHAGRLDPSAMVSIGVAEAFLVGAWVGLVTDLETTRVIDTTTWDLGSIDKAISEAMAFESTLLAVALLSPMIVLWCAVVGTAAQRYWAFRTIVGQLGATSGRDLIAGVLWAGLGFGLGTAAWPTGVYALDLGDAATIGTWLVSIIIGVGVGLVVTLLSFLIVWPFVHWTLRIFRRRPPPAWFLGTTTLLACYLLALLSQLAMAVIGLIDEDREVATIVSLASAAVAVAGWRGLAALTNWRRASGPATTATAGPPNWLLAPVDG